MRKVYMLRNVEEKEGRRTGMCQNCCKWVRWRRVRGKNKWQHWCPVVRAMITRKAA